MSLGEYRGVNYSIPDSDDGSWRWVVYAHERRELAALNVFPRPVYGTRDQAIKAAQRVIDNFLAGKAKRTLLNV